MQGLWLDYPHIWLIPSCRNDPYVGRLCSLQLHLRIREPQRPQTLDLCQIHPEQPRALGHSLCSRAGWKTSQFFHDKGDNYFATFFTKDLFHFSTNSILIKWWSISERSLCISEKSLTDLMGKHKALSNGTYQHHGLVAYWLHCHISSLKLWIYICIWGNDSMKC